MVVAIGRPEHSWRVHSAEIDVTVKQYFRPTPKSYRMSTSMTPKSMEQLTQNIRDQLKESVIEKVT